MKRDLKYSSPLTGQKGKVIPMPPQSYNYKPTYTSTDELLKLAKSVSDLANAWDIITKQDLTLDDKPERVTGQTLDELFAEDEEDG